MSEPTAAAQAAGAELAPAPPVLAAASPDCGLQPVAAASPNGDLQFVFWP